MNLGNGVDAVCAPGDGVDELGRLAPDEGELVLAAAGIPVVTEPRGRRRAARRHPALARRARGSRAAPPGRACSAAPGTVEIDYLSGEVVLLGRLHGVPTPVNELLQRVASELARDRWRPRSLAAADLLGRLR